MYSVTTTNDQDLLTELRILGSITENDRITTNHSIKPRIRIQKPSIFRSINRFLNSESRNNNIIFLQSLMQAVIEKYNGAVSQDNKSLITRLKSETISAIKGIKKLQTTYEDDLQFQACTEVLIETLQIALTIHVENINIHEINIKNKNVEDDEEHEESQML